MSCRVLDRRIEEFMLGVALTEARTRRIEKTYGRYMPTAKNRQIADLFHRLGFSSHTEDGDGASTWVLYVNGAQVAVVPIDEASTSS